MKCPRCQHDSRPRAKFCGQCGTPFKRAKQGGPPVASNLQRALSEALEQQTATSEIFGVISSSPANAPPRPRQALPAHRQARAGAGEPHTRYDDVPRDGHDVLAGEGGGGDEGNGIVSET
jgi:hypothetical protein